MSRLPRRERQRLIAARDAAALKDCGCSEEAKREMKLYLDTWVVWRLNTILEWADSPPAAQERKP